MSKKKISWKIVLRLLLAGLGSMMGALITLLLLVLLPSSFRIAPSLFVMNSGFWGAYWSSYSMKECALTPYFVCVFATMSVIVCLRFYGMTWFCVLNILGYFLTIAGFVLVGSYIRLIHKAAKKRASDTGDQDENG